MKKLISLLLVMLLLAPAALAQSHILILPIGEHGSSLLFNDEGEVIVSAGEYDVLFPVDAANGWFGARRTEDFVHAFALMNADGEILTGEEYVALQGAYADRIVFSREMDGDYRYGILNEAGTELIPATYVGITADGAGGFYAQLPGDDRLVKLDHDGNATQTEYHLPLRPYLSHAEWIPARATADGLVGYLNADLEWVIEPQFFSAEYFSGAHALVCNEDGLRGLIDKTGRLVLPMEFSYIAVGSALEAERGSNLAEVYTLDGEFRFFYEGWLIECGDYFIGLLPDGGSQLLDANGNSVRIVTAAEGAFYWLELDGGRLLPYFWDANTQLNHFVDAQGYPCPEGYLNIEFAGNPGNGDVFAVAVSESGTWTDAHYSLIDSNGNAITDAYYISLSVFSGANLVSFEDQTGYGVIDLTGRELLRIDR